MDYRRRRLSQRIRTQVVIAAWLMLTVLVQTMLLPTIVGAIINLALAATVCWTLVDSTTMGAVVGFYGGLMLDLLSQSPLGSHALALLLVAGGTALIAQRFPADNWIVPLLMVATLTPLYQVLVQVAAGGTNDWLSWAVVVLVPAIVINAAIALPTFLVIRWWAERRA